MLFQQTEQIILATLNGAIDYQSLSMMGAKEKKKKMTVKESHEILINDESDKLIEQDKIVKAAKLQIGRAHV